MKLRKLVWMAGILAGLSALALAAAACGGDDDGKASPAATATAANTPSPTTQPASTPAASVGKLKIMAPSGRITLDNGAAYMTIMNTGSTDDALVAAATDIAGKVELHETRTEGNTTSMQPVEKIDVPAGGEAVLKKGGLHVMMMDVKQGLKVGDKFDLTLTFEKAGPVTFSITIAEIAASDPGMNGMATPAGSMGAGSDSGMGSQPSPAMGGGMPVATP